MWIGQAVHEQIRRVVTKLSCGNTVPYAQALREMATTMLEQWKASKDHRYRINPKGIVGLMEHYYGEPYEYPIFKADFKKAAKCLKNFYESSIYRLLTQDAIISVLQIEMLQSILIEGIQVWVKLDLALREEPHFLRIVDWKTGVASNKSALLQLGVYSLYAIQTWHSPVESIVLHEVELQSGTEMPDFANESLIRRTRAYICQSAGEMRSSLAEPKKNVAHIDDFPMTTNLRVCSRCNFRRHCKRE
jgi:hypothetical protein